jgi:hypothetical protein
MGVPGGLFVGGAGCSWVVRSLGKLVQRDDLEGRGGRLGGGVDSQDGWFPTVCIAAIPSSSTISTSGFIRIFSIFLQGHLGIFKVFCLVCAIWGG